ncbi:MAG: hypothetical protein EPN88_07330 [Bacteroidetes bacterium]|nr:MAG: hypothetical protein EPN88_07330 [Bacteroidota bacterium]
MNRIIDIIGWITCNLGVAYFLIRMIYLSTKTSFSGEIKAITTFQYFSPFLIVEEDEIVVKRIKKLLNTMLKIFYIMIVILMLVAMIKIVIGQMLND